MMMRRMMMLFVAGAMAFAVGCASPIEANCQKSIECKELPDEIDTVEKCVELVEDLLDGKDADSAECKEVRKAMEAVYACAAKLSCDERKKDEIESCKKEEDAVEKAMTEAVKAEKICVSLGF